MPADAVDALIRAAHHVGRGDGEISAVVEAREVVLALLDGQRDPNREGAIALCRAMAEWCRETIRMPPPIENCKEGGAVELAEAAVRQYHTERGRRGATNTPAHAWDSAATLLAKGWRP